MSTDPERAAPVAATASPFPDTHSSTVVGEGESSASQRGLELNAHAQLIQSDSRMGAVVFTGDGKAASTSKLATLISSVDPLEISQLDMKQWQSPSSAIDACLFSLSARTIELIRMPPLVLADRPLEIEFAAVSPHVGACTASSMARCLSFHALLSITVESRGQSCSPLYVPVTARPSGSGCIARALICPATWADASVVTIASLSIAGRPQFSNCLPATLGVGYNHALAPAGAVLAASKAGDVPALQAALDAGGSTEETDESGWTALYWAAANGHLDALRALLAAGASPAASAVSMAPLHGAAMHNHVHIVALLLATPGVDPLAKYESATPIDVAIMFGGSATVALLKADPRVAAWCVATKGPFA